MIIPSNIIWFDDDDWLGLELSFPAGSTWRLTKKIKESEDIYSQSDHEDDVAISEARAVFVASRGPGAAPTTAVLKVHMQIPWWGSATKKPLIRAQQAVPETSTRGTREVEALTLLTKAGCSSTPHLIDWMKRQQTQDEWVPGGYIHFIVMEKVPGVDVSLNFDTLDRKERDELRAAFKTSFLECTACGIVNRDSGSQNLRWDAERQKCYIIDWEMHHPSRKRDEIWSDKKFISWNLARVGEDGDYDDMSTWTL
ncbi:uncharacterized protein AKAW2_81176S [Aspergillus luchuensis]|uniref:Uncharacterized protein n=2 Tax=Aspergillus kawachii TaxID=1069201 RepID=A0A7R7WMD7_ASPKA|nr:uncharacterized protein AKAW2_81176S [Aspergillus luchuensis]BCS05375.1 hypothetical protein AKAW2_81176S [Aspergillus luchuensis]